MKETRNRQSARRSGGWRKAALGAVATLLALGALLGLGCGSTPTGLEPCEPETTLRQVPLHEQQGLDPCSAEGS